MPIRLTRLTLASPLAVVITYVASINVSAGSTSSLALIIVLSAAYVLRTVVAIIIVLEGLRCRRFKVDTALSTRRGRYAVVIATTTVKAAVVEDIGKVVTSLVTSSTVVP